MKKRFKEGDEVWFFDSYDRSVRRAEIVPHWVNYKKKIHYDGQVGIRAHSSKISFVAEDRFVAPYTQDGLQKIQRIASDYLYEVVDSLGAQQEAVVDDISKIEAMKWKGKRTK